MVAALKWAWADLSGMLFLHLRDSTTKRSHPQLLYKEDYGRSGGQCYAAFRSGSWIPLCEDEINDAPRSAVEASEVFETLRRWLVITLDCDLILPAPSAADLQFDFAELQG